MTMQALTHEYGPGCWCGRDCSTTPTPLPREAPFTDAHGLIHCDDSYGACVRCRVWEDDEDDEPVYRTVAWPCPAARLAEHEVVGRALARLPVGSSLHRFADGWGVLGLLADMHPIRPSIPEAIDAVLGPSEGERTDG